MQQETPTQKTERLIREINRIHAQYSQDYFETGKVAKLNLSRTLAHVPAEHILSYRLNLDEAINDYLAFADSWASLLSAVLHHSNQCRFLRVLNVQTSFFSPPSA